jgi:transposase-like protein
MTETILAALLLVGVEVVLHQHDLLGLRKICIGRIPENVGEIDSRVGFFTPRAGATGSAPEVSGQIAMDCVGSGSAAVTERPELTAHGYRRFRCRDCDQQFNERSDDVFNRVSLPSDIIAFVLFCRLRYRLTLQDLSEIMLLRGFTVSHESIRRWEAKLLPVMGEALRKRQRVSFPPGTPHLVRDGDYCL